MSFVSQPLPAVRLVLSALAGWLAFLLAWTVYIFGLPHDSHFAPELGPDGVYIIFGAVCSVFYLLDFILLAIPCFILLSSRILTNLVLRIVTGAMLFGVSVPIWCLPFTTSTGWDGSILALIAGAGCFVAWKPLSPIPNAA